MEDGRAATSVAFHVGPPILFHALTAPDIVSLSCFAGVLQFVPVVLVSLVASLVYSKKSPRS